jgi:hypothetical protein
MGKVIRLKESDIRKAILQTISEQQAGADETNPLDMIKPSPKVMPEKSPQSNPVSQEKPNGMNTPTPNEKILTKKIAIRTGLKRLLADVNELIVHSGINPQTNNIVRYITKVQEKFESLFGEPVTEDKGEE